ncbi:hypothetical protein Pcinc_010550 [Petrolisthes cinctipes]|uniref:RNase H type-1 domain-containing protein n=1 Tax=Petrolisthes cinctipes TaxID=88211 RepID=A0AAE1G4I0_PETCI|nr:hypothetical protein Pcinc_010550 [Petrolisthes cinctipes]
MVLAILEWLVLLGRRYCRVTFCWVPAHVGVDGNEWADVLAKAATSSSRQSVRRHLVPAVDLRPYINAAIRSCWRDRWDAIGVNKLHGIRQHLGLWSYSILFCRWETALACLCIGHTLLTHGFLMERAPSPCARRQINFRKQKDDDVKTYSSLRPKSVVAPSQEAAASYSSENVSTVSLHNSFSVFETVSDTHSGDLSTDDNSQALSKGVHVVEVHTATRSPKWKLKSTKLQQRRLRGSSETLDYMDVSPCKATVSVDLSIFSSQFHQKRFRGSDESLDSTDIPPRKLPLGTSEGHEVNVDASDIVTSKDTGSLPLEQWSDSSTCIIDVDVQSRSKVLQPADFGSSDEAVTYFTDMLHSAALNSIPRTSGYFPKRPVTWWSPVCTTAVREKRAAFSRLRRNRGDPTLLEDFRRARARARRVL